MVKVIVSQNEIRKIGRCLIYLTPEIIKKIENFEEYRKGGTDDVYVFTSKFLLCIEQNYMECLGEYKYKLYFKLVGRKEENQIYFCITKKELSNSSIIIEKFTREVDFLGGSIRECDCGSVIRNKHFDLCECCFTDEEPTEKKTI